MFQEAFPGIIWIFEFDKILDASNSSDFEE